MHVAVRSSAADYQRMDIDKAARMTVRARPRQTHGESPARTPKADQRSPRTRSEGARSEGENHALKISMRFRINSIMGTSGSKTLHVMTIYPRATIQRHSQFPMPELMASAYWIWTSNIAC